MNSKELALIVIILSICGTLTWILGLIQGNIYLFIASLIILVLTIPIAIKNYDSINSILGRTKHLNLVNESAYKMSFGLSNGILIYLGIGLITLRNSFPDLVTIGYILILIVIMEFAIYIFAQKYYEERY